MGLKIKRVNKDEWIDLSIAELQTSRIDKINKFITIRGVKYDLRTAQETEAKGGTSQTNAMYSYKVDFVFKTLKEAEEANVSVAKSIYVVNEKRFYIKDHTAFVPRSSYNGKILETTNDHLITETENARIYLIDAKNPNDLQRVLTVKEYDVENGSATNVLRNEALFVFRQGGLVPVTTADGEEPYEGDVLTIKNERICWAAPRNGSGTGDEQQK